MAKTIILPPGTGSYVTVLEPRADLKGNLKYSVTLLIAKARTAELEPLRKLATEVAVAKWGPKGATILANAKYPLIRDGDKKVDDEGKVDSIYKGMYYVVSRTDRKPQVIDALKNQIFTDEDVYSGCLMRISGAVFAYEAEGNKGVSVGLNNVQVLRKGPRLDGRKDATEEFTEWKDPGAAEADPTA